MALSAAGHEGGSRVHTTVQMLVPSPDRAPWRGLWAFKVVKIWQATTGRLSAELEPSTTMETHANRMNNSTQKYFPCSVL